MSLEQKRAAKPMTEKRLRNIASWYCSRYQVSQKKLEDYLLTKLNREVRDPEARSSFKEKIPGLISDLVKTGLVNDKEAASAGLRKYLRTGYATHAAIKFAAISAKVDEEKVKNELENAINESLPEIEARSADNEGSEIKHALAALKRYKRGPFRSNSIDDTTHRRDANWLARRGFNSEIIRKVLDLEPLDG